MASYNANVPPPTYYAPPMNNFVQSPGIHKIRDWLPWSIVNIFLGWFIGGIIALIFSILCRNKKRENDMQGARSMSTLSLVINIISTVIGILGWIGIIIYIVFYVRWVKEFNRP